jgi:hypothetical protein
VCSELHGAARHRGDELFVRRVGDGTARHLTAVAQHREAAGDAPHFVEKVRHVEDRESASAQALEHGEQPLGVVAPEATRRLVEDEQTAACVGERARDFDELLLGGRKLRDARVRRDRLRAPLHEPERAARAFHGRFSRQDTEARRFRAEHDVVRYREVRAERELLVHDRDAQAPRGERSGWRVR